MIIRPLGLLVALSLAALGLVACGGDDNQDGQAAQKGTPAEMAFLTGMVHHHGTALQMSEIARERGKSPFVKTLANEIIDAQKQEIGEMRSIHQRLFGRALEPDPMAHDGLGLSAEEAGMTHTPAKIAELRKAKPFDRAFVDDMVPHHQGAIRMAEAVMRDGRDPAVRQLAEKVIATQKREVDEMNAFRQRSYGAPVPDSAVPSGGKEMPPGAGGEHGGH